MNLSKKARIFLGVIVLSIVAFFYVYKTVYKPHDQIEDQEVSFIGTSDELKTKVIGSSETLQNTYIQIGGMVTSTDEVGVTLSETIYCVFKNPKLIGGIKANDKIQIKARFIGYDDLLEEVRLDQCILVNK